MTSKRFPPPSPELDLLLDALENDRPSKEEAEAAVARLGINVKSFAAEVRGNLMRADETQRVQRLARAQDAYERERAEFSRRPNEPIRPRVEQERILKTLIKRAGEAGVAAHYQKYEGAHDEELAAMIASLRHLLGDTNGVD
jgi:hypothetical protein